MTQGRKEGRKGAEGRGRSGGPSWTRPGLVHGPTLPPAPASRPPQCSSGGTLPSSLPGRHLVSSTYFLTDMQPDPTCPPEGHLACHKAVSPFQGHAAPAPACSKQKAHRTLGGWWTSGSNVTSPAGSATPRHHRGHRGRPGGSFRWGLGVAGRKRQRAFRVLRAHPGARRARLTRHRRTGHLRAADHSGVTASGRDPGPLASQPPTSHPPCPLLQGVSASRGVSCGKAPRAGHLKQQ